MAITYSWIIESLDVIPQEGTLVDVVSVVHWRRRGVEVDGDKTYTAEVYSTYNCPSPSPTDFTAYADLTQAQVESWLNAGLDVPSIDANIATQIQNQIQPPVITPPLPWQTAPSSNL